MTNPTPQRHVLRGFRTGPGHFGAYVITDVTAFRSWLLTNLPPLPHEGEPPELLVAFTRTGLAKMGHKLVAQEQQGPIGVYAGRKGGAFSLGAATRILAIEGRSPAGYYRWSWGVQTLDVVVLRGAGMPPTEAFAAPTGCVAVREVSGEHRPAKDSLGFAEGISQPQVVRGASNPADLDERSVGDFLVGDGPADLQDLPGLPGWAKGGSFLVAVDYRVDREGFWMWANRVGAEYGVSGTRVAAAVVGRDPSGIALAIPPDPKVPVTAHIRRANPRHGGKSDLPRILRRSIPYQDNGQPGLMFLCYQASIDHQFEVILREWCFSALPGDPADSRDALLGRTQKQGRIDLGELTPDGGHTWVDAPDPWILSVGGAYAFAPSMETLARFATQEPLKA